MLGAGTEPSPPAIDAAHGIDPQPSRRRRGATRRLTRRPPKLCAPQASAHRQWHWAWAHERVSLAHRPRLQLSDG